MRLISILIVFIIICSSVVSANASGIVNFVGKCIGEKGYLMVLSKDKTFYIRGKAPEGLKEGEYVEVKGIERIDRDGMTYIWALQIKRLIPKSIGDIIRSVKDYLGKRLLISGEFRGWEGSADPPPVTRSDWIVKDDTGYIYVLGAPPFNPIEDKGKEIVVIGTLKISKGDIPYIEPILVEGMSK
ncbi:MAG: hypothetical protein ACP5K2_06445 [bacterium]